MTLELKEDLPERRHVVYLWIGPAETVLDFHKDNHNSYDWINNIFVQICGRKHVVMVSGDQDMFMYKRAPEEGDAYHSHISDPRNVDFSKYPLFRKATLFEAIVYPGETAAIAGLHILSQFGNQLHTLFPELLKQPLGDVPPIPEQLAE